MTIFYNSQKRKILEIKKTINEKIKVKNFFCALEIAIYLQFY